MDTSGREAMSAPSDGLRRAVSDTSMMMKPESADFRNK